VISDEDKIKANVSACAEAAAIAIKSISEMTGLPICFFIIASNSQVGILTQGNIRQESVPPLLHAVANDYSRLVQSLPRVQKVMTKGEEIRLSLDGGTGYRFTRSEAMQLGKTLIHHARGDGEEIPTDQPRRNS
jgi:hypothetical protein